MRHYRSNSVSTLSPQKFYEQYLVSVNRIPQSRVPRASPALRGKGEIALTPRKFGQDRILQTEPSERRKSLRVRSQSYSETPSLVYLDVSGLKPYADDFYLRSLCTGTHIVELNTDIDNFTGQCKGTAQISVRTSNKALDELKLKLTYQGLYVRIKSPPKAQGDQNLRGMYPGKNSIVRTSRPDLLTSDDLFGSSPGVGRAPQNNKTPDRKLNQSLLLWNKVQQQQKTPRSGSSIRSFMRATISSLNKSHNK